MPRTGRSSASSVALLLIVLLATGASPGAFVSALDPQTLAEAISIGQGRINDARARFHAPYHVEVGKAPVDYIEVVTPFRRIALDAEARAHSGDRLYGQRDALATLGDEPGRVDVVVELTLHPLNTFIGVPEYPVNLQAAVDTPLLPPRQIARIPRFGPRLAGMPLPYAYAVGAPTARNGSQPLLGGSLVATFDSPPLDAQGAYWVVVSDFGKNGKELARVRVDFGKLR